MGFREHINKLSDEGKLVKVDTKISKRLEISGLLKAMEPTPIIFENVKESNFKVVGNLF